MNLAKYCFASVLAVILLGCAPDDVDTPMASGSKGDLAVENNVDQDSEVETVIVFLGDSITAGYGISRDDAFPARVERALRESGYQVTVRESGVSGETTAGGLRRINWILNQSVDILVIELGGNDGLRGIPVEEIERNLRGMISRTREKNPNVEIIVSGMQIPPNMGQTYTQAFGRVFSRVATDEGVGLIPFILDGVGGIPELNLPDGIHPTEEGHEIIARTVLEVLEPVVANLQVASSEYSR